MQANYEQMVKAQENQPGLIESRVCDEVKFDVVCILPVKATNFY